jgi:hypothetical protein
VRCSAAVAGVVCDAQRPPGSGTPSSAAPRSHIFCTRVPRPAAQRRARRCGLSSDAQSEPRVQPQCVSFEDFVRDRTVPKPAAQPRKPRETSFDNFVRDVEVGRVSAALPAVRETSFAFFLRSRDEPPARAATSEHAVGESAAVSLLEGPHLHLSRRDDCAHTPSQSPRRRSMSESSLAQSTASPRRSLPCWLRGSKPCPRPKSFGARPQVLVCQNHY